MRACSRCSLCAAPAGERFKQEFQKYEYFSPTYTYIGWNNDHPIFRDKRVRQAMTYFTDRKQMVKTMLVRSGRSGRQADLFFPARSTTGTLVSYPFDPKRALELLNQAGWNDSDGDGILDKVIDGKKMPLRFEIKVNSGNATRKSVALALLKTS